MPVDPSSYEAVYEHAPCGYVVTDRSGVIARANREFLRLVGRRDDEVVGQSLQRFVSVGGRIYFETHLFPLLAERLPVREIALDVVRPDGSRIPVLLNADRSGPDEVGDLVRTILVEARDRRRYETDLLVATQAAETERRRAAALAATLQEALVPSPPPVIPGLDVAAAYHPAGDGRIGGDFFEVFQSSASTWIIAVGDVTGKGARAATVTSLVRHTLRALAMQESDPELLLAGVDRVLREEDTDRFCTVALASLHRHEHGWTVRLGLAGHPAPLLRRPDGQVVEAGRYGTVLGITSDPSFHTVELDLRGSALVLYTDGVTEARSQHGLFGEDRLVAVVRSARHTADALTAAVVDAAVEFQDGWAADDIAVVTVTPSAPT